MTLFGKCTLITTIAALGAITLSFVFDVLPLKASESSRVASQQSALQWYIVQGTDPVKLRTVIESAGGSVDKQFPIINAVSAMMTPLQVEQIKQISGVKVTDDRSVKTMSALTLAQSSKEFRIDTYVNTQIDANILHDKGITGAGVTVAVIDSGANMGGRIGWSLFTNSRGMQRAAVKYDAFSSTENYLFNDDNNGHGSHVTGIIASSFQDTNRNYNGVAPDVFLVSVKAFNENGDSSYSTLLDALNWVAVNQDRFNMKVLNMSLGAEAQSRYWNDPINQAVMHLWHKGITVVTSAGNNGEELGITVPGNNPYVITVGATTHNDTPFLLDDDRVASFSAQGPTYDGFVKPDVVAPGAKIAVKLDDIFFTTKLKLSETGQDYSVISGTSQSSAVVAGIAALVIQAHPGISPDDVKCKIISAAKAARTAEQYLISPFEQGSGMVNAYDAVTSNANACANNGLNVEAELQGQPGYFGPVNKVGDMFTINLTNGSVLTEGAHWGAASADLLGAHWGAASADLLGAHWGSASAGLLGAHWGAASADLLGAHWGAASADLLGAHWSASSPALLGAHWGKEKLNLLGVDWEVEVKGVSENENVDSNNIPSVIELNPWQ